MAHSLNGCLRTETEHMKTIDQVMPSVLFAFTESLRRTLKTVGAENKNQRISEVAFHKQK